ncbi:unnamed protein product [Lathyrus sativus]|nr:unnamed protein product [Lathyrus sativus]
MASITSKLTMRLLIGLKTAKVNFVKASKPAVDFIFHMLCLPIDSIGNMYQSVRINGDNHCYREEQTNDNEEGDYYGEEENYDSRKTTTITMRKNTIILKIVTTSMTVNVITLRNRQKTTQMVTITRKKET